MLYAVPSAWKTPPLYPHVAGSLSFNLECHFLRETSLISLPVTNSAPRSITSSWVFLNLLLQNISRTTKSRENNRISLLFSASTPTYTWPLLYSSLPTVRLLLMPCYFKAHASRHILSTENTLV